MLNILSSYYDANKLEIVSSYRQGLLTHSTNVILASTIYFRHFQILRLHEYANKIPAFMGLPFLVFYMSVSVFSISSSTYSSEHMQKPHLEISVGSFFFSINIQVTTKKLYRIVFMFKKNNLLCIIDLYYLQLLTFCIFFLIYLFLIWNGGAAILYWFLSYNPADPCISICMPLPLELPPPPAPPHPSRFVPQETADLKPVYL